LSLQGVASPSLLIHGGAGLHLVRGHPRAPAKPHELGLHDGGRAHGLSCARGHSEVLCTQQSKPLINLPSLEYGPPANVLHEL
jgi:hypothetical protein